jgi:hypothetical protein
VPNAQRSSAQRKLNRSVSFKRGKERRAYRAEEQRLSAIRNKKEGTSPWAKAKAARAEKRRALQMLKK